MITFGDCLLVLRCICRAEGVPCHIVISFSHLFSATWPIQSNIANCHLGPFVGRVAEQFEFVLKLDVGLQFDDNLQTFLTGIDKL